MPERKHNNQTKTRSFKSKFGTLFRKLKQGTKGNGGAQVCNNDKGNEELDSPRKPVFLQSSEPQLIMKQNQMTQLDHLRTMIIGYGLEVEGFDAPQGSSDHEQACCLMRKANTDLHNNLPESMLGSTFTFSIRGHAVMYDRWGFIVYSGCGMKDCNKDKMYEYERRRRHKSSLNIQCLDSHFNVSLVNDSSKQVQSNAAASSESKHEIHHLNSPQSYEIDVEQQQQQQQQHVEDMEDECLVTSETMFVQNDTCYDLEQIRIHINDPTEVHHILVLLDFDTCQMNREFMSYLPHIRAYVRLIDAQTGNEVIRYYIDEIPKITVALELNRIETAEQRMLLDEVHRQRLQQELHVHIPTEVTRGAVLDVEEEEEEAVNEGGDSPDTPRYMDCVEETNTTGLSASQQLQPESSTTITTMNEGEMDEETLLCETLYDKKMREIEMLSLVMQRDLSWNVVTLKHEWFFNPREALMGDNYLASFLSQVDLNMLGTDSIPKILPAAFKVDVIKAKNLQGKKLYCKLFVNSLRYNAKVRTRATRKHIWERSFKFLTEPGYRACTIVVDIWEMHHLSSDTHLGQVLIPFGMVTDPEEPVFEADFPVCKVSAPRKGSVIGLLSCRVELLLLGI